MNLKSEFHIAFKWIIDTLHSLDISYQVVGGLAAKFYGSTRPLHDIDFYVPHESFSKLEQELKEHIVFGPKLHQDENWDLVFMKLNYKNQLIEFGDADNTKYFNSDSQRWVKEKIDFAEPNVIEFEGIEVNVMPRQKLIQYKQRLNRKVDQIDIREIQKQA